MTPTPNDDALKSLLQKAMEDLGSRLSIPVNEVSLIEWNEEEWSDSRLGCPQPGMSYLQVITPGYQMIFQANGQTYEYHSNKSGHFVYCSDQAPPAFRKP